MHTLFSGTEHYVATDDLMMAVNAAITLQRPLLVKGEPGTGKTMLAEEVARALGRELIVWPIKSTSKAQQGLYEYDAVSRLRDAQLGDSRSRDVGEYIIKGKLWEAFDADQAPVLLIDEIDKADIEFPNDLLQELDKMEFYVYETNETIKAKQRPIIIITSNNEKELPDAFLRRCFFHYIAFPDRETLKKIVDAVQASKKPEVISPSPQATEPTVAVKPACPRCGSAMVKRVAKQGANAGNAFWGCASYPQCRGVRAID